MNHTYFWIFIFLTYLSLSLVSNLLIVERQKLANLSQKKKILFIFFSFQTENVFRFFRCETKLCQISSHFQIKCVLMFVLFSRECFWYFPSLEENHILPVLGENLFEKRAKTRVLTFLSKINTKTEVSVYTGLCGKKISIIQKKSTRKSSLCESLK